MITSSTALHRAVRTKQPEMISSPGVCPDCRGPMTVSFSALAARDFPALESWSWILVCNDCANFRHALRERSETLIRKVHIYRSTCLSICRKGLDPDKEIEMLTKAKTELSTPLLAAVKTLVAAVAYRARRPIAMCEMWAAECMDIFETRNTYAGADYRWVSLNDQTPRIIEDIKREYGVTTPNHWRKIAILERDIPD